MVVPMLSVRNGDISMGAVLVRRRTAQQSSAVVSCVLVGCGLLCGLPGCGESGSDAGSGSPAVNAEGEPIDAGPAYTLDPTEAPRDEVLSRLEVGAMEMLDPLFGGAYGVAERESLAKAYGTAMEMYLFGSVDDFIASLDESQARTAEHLELFRRQWEYGASTVSSSPMDPNGISANFAVIGGERIDDKPRLGLMMVEGTRSGKDGIGDPRAMGLDVVEIAVPMRLKPVEGKRVEGRFGLSFAFDPRRGEWVLVGNAVGSDDTEANLIVPPL